jgi:serine/threonine protein kinase
MDIYNYMHKEKKSFSHNEIRKIFWQIVKAMNYCHQKKIMHRDIKTSNILISDDCKTVKIADFGLARTYDLPLKTYTHEVVTIWYRAPEILLGQNQYGTAIDVWALGCVFYELAHKKPLFSARTEIEQLMKIFKLLGTPHENNW